MSDAWEEIQAVKSKRNELRERLQKRRKERQDLLEGGEATSSIKTDVSKLTGMNKTKRSYILLSLILHYIVIR